MGKYKIPNRFDINYINGIKANLIWATNEFRGGKISAPPPPVSREIDTANLKAAYSLSLLQAGYTGAAIRVRRTSDNSELDIGFNGINLDEAALTTFCSGTNGFVAAWYDQSGNGFDFTQTVTTSQPQIVSGGIIYKNIANKPTINFYQTDLSANFTQSQPFAVYLVMNTSAATTFILNPVIWLRATQHQVHAGLWLYGGAYTLGTDHLFTCLFDTTTNLYGNSALKASGNAGTGGISPKFQTYPSAYIGYGSEILVYSKTTNRTAIETNINDYYSIY